MTNPTFRVRGRPKLTSSTSAAKVRDTFQNFGLGIGLGTDNALTGSTYGFNPISRVRILLEWIYRGSWLAGMAVDTIADDMSREGVELINLDPSDVEVIEQEATELRIWEAYGDLTRWARLYGGAIGVHMIEGQDMSQPLRIETVGPDQYKGMYVFDRWMVEPTLSPSFLVDKMGPHIGMPKYYDVASGMYVFSGQRIHYTRCFRMDGVQMPFNQRMQENLWGVSVLERLYDRLVAFDSATMGAAQMMYKSHLRTLSIDGMRELMASGGDAAGLLMKYTDMMRRFQSIEGIALIDAKDTFQVQSVSAFAGVGEALIQFGQQVSGAIGAPLVRLFGQSPAGLNSTGESDFRMYYDNLHNHQEKDWKSPTLITYKLIARSKGIKLGDDFQVKFKPLWQLTDEQKGTIDERDVAGISSLEQSGLIDRPTALRELKARGRVTGRWQVITDEVIAEAEEQAEQEPPGPAGAMPGQPEAGPLEGGAPPPAGPPGGEKGPPPAVGQIQPPKLPKAPGEHSPGGGGAGEGGGGAGGGDSAIRDGAPPPLTRHFRGLTIVVEYPAGARRYRSTLPADYGFIKDTSSAEGLHEPMDVIVGKDERSPHVWIVDHMTDDRFEEHKCLLGFPDERSALDAYVQTYATRDSARTMQRNEMGDVRHMSFDEFARWLRAGDMTAPILRQSLGVKRT